MSQGANTITRRRHLARWLAFGGLAALLAAPGWAAWRLVRSARLARQSEPYGQHGRGDQRQQPGIEHGRAHRQRVPQLDITHRGQDGARMADLPLQMQGAGPCDVLLIQAGGNDVIRLRELDALRADVERVLHRAPAVAPLVLLMPCGNVGNAPFFLPPLSG